jgi:hypothetical protein
MIFTTEQTSALESLLAAAPYAGQSQEQILALLNTPTEVANPTPQGTVFVNPILSETTLLGLLTDPTNGSGAKLINYPNLASVLADIDANNHEAVALWAGRLALVGIVTAGEATAIEAYCMASELDPAWQATLPIGSTPFQLLFPGVSFAVSPSESHVGTCTPDMLTEVLS